MIKEEERKNRTKQGGQNEKEREKIKSLECLSHMKQR